MIITGFLGDHVIGSINSGWPKIDTFCVCAKLEKCVNLWRADFRLYFPEILVEKLTFYNFENNLKKIFVTKGNETFNRFFILLGRP